MYYLANATNLNLKQIHGIFAKSGLRKEIGRIENYLQMAKININEMIERREAMGIVIGAIQQKTGAKTRKKKTRWRFRRK